MAQTNTKAKTSPLFTAEGGRASSHLTPMQQLRRSVMSCMLFEGEFYEDGEEIAARIHRLAKEVPPEELAALAVEVRTEGKLRHAPLLLLDALTITGAGKPGLVSNAICDTIQRADEMAELLAIYWRKGKKPLSGQLKKGLAKAFQKFNAHTLSKWNRDNAVRMRDVLFLTHAKPKDEAQAEVWKKLIDGTLESPETWEVIVSGASRNGLSKKEAWEKVIDIWIEESSP